MLYLVGLGLSDETDITVKGLEVVKKASRVYLEAYTSILLVDQSVLVRTQAQFHWQKVVTSDRNPTMADPLLLPIARWWNQTATRSYEMHKTKTWHSVSLAILLGKLGDSDALMRRIIKLTIDSALRRIPTLF